MKVCPVCGARAFDDAPMCFGCLHRFEENAREDEVPLDAENVVGEGFERRTEVFAEPIARPPAFLIRFTPMVDEAGGVEWSCAVVTDPCIA